MNIELEKNITIKRGAQSDKMFDRLSLCAPVTVTTKILLYRLLSLKLDWDEDLIPDIRETWTQLAKELSDLREIPFSRHVIDNDYSLMYIFCDASPQDYGFGVYGVQNGKSHIKFKVAPMQTKTLPSMELLTVYLAFKDITTFLKTY